MEANLLNRHWSSESISLRLRRDLPSQTQTVSHTTIYRWIAKDRAALEVSFTAVSGAMAGNSGFSRLFSARVIERKTADPVSAAMVEMLWKVKGKLHTLTLDNGGEFAEHRKRTEATGVPVSFASPCVSSGNGEPTKTAMDACEGCDPKSLICQHVQRETLRTAFTTPGKVRKGLTSWEVFTGKRVARIT